MTRVVIDIPDEDFSLLREAYGEVELKSTLNLRLQSAVAHGTVLPEGHGDLIERKKLIDNFKRFNDINVSTAVANVEIAPTVIEADKESVNE